MSLQKQIKQFQASNPDWKDARIARKIKVSSARFSQWMRGIYPGNNKLIDDAIKIFLDANRLQGIDPKEDFEFAETEIMKKIAKAADASYENRQIRVVTGRWGIGKTTSIKKYVERHPSAILVECYEGITKKRFIQNLSRAAGFTPSSSFAETLEDLFVQLKSTRRLIILDEAEDLPVVALDAARRIHDMTGCGVLLVGSSRLVKNLTLNIKDYGYIYSRCGIPVKLPAISFDDAKQLIATVINNTEYNDDLYKGCNGSARDLKNLLFDSLRASDEAGFDIEKDVAEVKSIIRAFAVKLARREERD